MSYYLNPNQNAPGNARRRPSMSTGFGAPSPVLPTYTGVNPNYPNQVQYPNTGIAYGTTPPVPPGADPTLWGWFTAVDTDGSGTIHVDELQQALVNGNWSTFDLDTCKMLMGIFDVRKTGSIAFNEFCGLWKYIQEWQNVFRHFDTDSSGSIEGDELANALARFGYRLTPYLLSLVESKYATVPLNQRNQPMYGRRPTAGMTFDRFVRACVVIKNLTETFQGLDTNRDGRVSFDYEQFLAVVLSSP